MRFISLAALFFVVSVGMASARAVQSWSYAELLDKSDLVVIATPAGTSDTQEHIDMPGFAGEHVIGVETKFVVSAVLKGEKKAKEIVLHHYRPAEGTLRVPNGPTYISFPPTGKEPWPKPAFLLFLVSEPVEADGVRPVDGRYSLVVGQTDPGLGIRRLAGAGGEPTKMTTDQLADILKRCETIKPGMTRGELEKVFSTEGGLSTVQHRTYVFSSLPYIKVDVDFEIGEPKQTEEKPTDVISKISKPYLEWSVGD